MLIPTLLAAMLALPGNAVVPPESEIIVRGYPWAPFISPMGEPFRAHSTTDDTLANWFRQADRNRDGWLTAVEMQADADRFFAKLDTNQDDTIEPDELIQYEWEVAPEIQVNVRAKRKRGDPVPVRKHPAEGNSFPSEGHGHGPEHRLRDTQEGLQGAARYALLNMPEPVAAADLNFDRSITLGEFRRAAVERFQLLDTGRGGALGLAQLQQQLASAEAAGKKRKRRNADDEDSRIGIPLPKSN